MDGLVECGADNNLPRGKRVERGIEANYNPKKSQIGGKLAARVRIRPSQGLVKLIHCAMFNKKPRMEMLRMAAPAKSVVVLKFTVFIVVCNYRGTKARV